MKKNPLVAIVGPTAIGKTDIAIKVANHFNGEIVSADSMQIYRHMNIGTAKPTIEEMQGIPHYMVDIVDPDEEFSVALFQQGANNAIEDINNRKRLPILSGGTGLYIHSIMYPLNFSSTIEDTEYRTSLKDIADKYGNAYVHNLLKKVDPVTAEKLHPNDNRRVIRALEVYHITGRAKSEYDQSFCQADIPYDLIIIGLNMERQALYSRINMRVDQMIDNGLVEEVEGLLNMGYSKNLVSMQGLGYKEIVGYIDGTYSKEECIELLKRDTRRFAKRQLTWFRREQMISWIEVDSFSSADDIISWINQHIEKRLAL